MKTPRQSPAGAVLIFALLVLVVGASILGGIAQLAVTQSVAGRSEWESAARRIQLENSRAMARQYIMSQMWRGFGQLPTATLDNSTTGGLGGFSITNVDPPFGYWLSLEQDATKRANPFNLFERGGFQSAWGAGSLSAGGGQVPWGFQVRTRSPITAGFAFVNQRPATNVWAPLQRINMEEDDYAVGFANLPRMPVSSVTNTNTGDTNGFLGFLLLPKAEAAFGDLLDPPTGVTTNAVEGSDPLAPDVPDVEIEIDLGTFGYYAVEDDSHFYEVPMAADVVTVDDGVSITNYNRPVTDLLLVGTEATGNLPLQIVIPANNTNLSTVTLSGGNSRIVYLYRQGTASPELRIATTGGNNTFRIGMTLDCAADLDITGGLTVRGGFRTGSSLTQSTGDFTMVAELNPTWKYDAIADRMMWLEDQRAR